MISNQNLAAEVWFLLSSFPTKSSRFSDVFPFSYRYAPHSMDAIGTIQAWKEGTAQDEALEARYTGSSMHPPEPRSEAELQMLVLKAQAGDTEAFARIYDHFFTPVFRYVSFRLPSEVAEDTVSDIFVRVWEKLHKYKARRGVPLGAWVFRIARHLVIDTYRSHRGLEELPEVVVDPDTMNRADDHTQREDVLRIVRAAMDQLPRRYREVLLLTFVSELPYNEVARVLHMTEGGVRILKMRALKKLEGLLPPDIASQA